MLSHQLRELALKYNQMAEAHKKIAELPENVSYSASLEVPTSLSPPRTGVE